MLRRSWTSRERGERQREAHTYTQFYAYLPRARGVRLLFGDAARAGRSLREFKPVPEDRGQNVE